MNREETIEAIKVMQGFVDGKTIQFKSPIDDMWSDIEAWPVWNFVGDTYRVKPEPRVIHFVEFSDGSLGSKALDLDEVANFEGPPTIRSTRLVKFIEVLE